MKVEKKVDVSIVIFGIDDGIKTHKTILNTLRSCEEVASYEIAILASSTELSTNPYLSENKSFIEKNSVATWEADDSFFCGIGPSVIAKISGRYTCCVRAGDLMSHRYIRDAIHLLNTTKTSCATYTNAVVEFYDKPYAKNRILDHPTPIDNSLARLLSVSANPIFDSLVVPTAILRGITYPVDAVGYSHFSTYLASELLHCSVELLRVPESCYYRRRYKPHGTADNFGVIPKTQLHRPSTARNILLPEELRAHANNVAKSRRTKDRVKHLLQSYPAIIKTAQVTLHTYHLMRARAQSSLRFGRSETIAENWLLRETKEVHSDEPRIFLYPDHAKERNIVLHNEAEKSYKNALYYRQACDYLRHDSYDYIILAPWLIAGGADMFVMNYANTIDELSQNRHVLVISTEPSAKSLDRSKLALSDDVDFLPLAEIIPRGAEYHDFCLHQLSLLVENLNPRAIQIANSLMGYEYLVNYGPYLKAKNIKLIATAYNEVIWEHGQRRGYVHEYVPLCYPQLSLITTDNQAIIDMWVREYGFSREKILLHHQPFKVPVVPKRRENLSGSGVHLLWASHVRKEKAPETATAIARFFAQDGQDVTIDCYGAIDKHHYPTSPFRHAPSNLQYKGNFTSFFDDIDLTQYDAFVYTSLFDGTPNILIEAGLAKIPIISSAIGGIPELLAGKAVLIDKPSDPTEFIEAIQDLVHDKSPFTKRSSLLHAALLKTQTYPAFKKEITRMLNILKND